MKQFVSLILIAGGLVVSSQSHALVNTKAQCVAACGSDRWITPTTDLDRDRTVLTDTCGWLLEVYDYRGRHVVAVSDAYYRRSWYNRCRAKLYNRCKRYGTATICPAPPSPTTTITQPPVVTTTTTTVPTTTTTLPVVTYPDLRGSYEFDGFVVSDPCGVYGVGTAYILPFDVTAQEGALIQGILWARVSVDAAGYYDGSINGWGLDTGERSVDGCITEVAIAVASIYLPADAGILQVRTCGGFSCTTELKGTVY